MQVQNDPHIPLLLILESTTEGMISLFQRVIFCRSMIVNLCIDLNLYIEIYVTRIWVYLMVHGYILKIFQYSPRKQMYSKQINNININ